MEHKDGQLRVSWRAIAIASVVLALAASVLAAIVSSIRQVDALSVIALALAVIAFVVQIIVYIAQADAAAKQQIQAAEVYASTISALTAIEEKAEGTRTTINTLSDRLLEAAIGKAIPEAESQGEALTSENFAETVTRIVQDMLNTPAATPASAPKPQPRRRSTDSSMRKLPTGERLAEALNSLDGLTESQLSQLFRLGIDQARSGGGDDPRIGPGLPSVNPYAVKELVNRNLVARRHVPWSANPVFQLTEKGKDTARVLLGDDRDTSDPRVAAIRARHDKYRAELTKRANTQEMYKDIPIEE